MSWDLLFEAFRSEFPDSDYRRGARVLRVEDDGQAAAVTFEDGATDTGDLVVGADGIGSIVRASVAPDSEPIYAGYVAFRGLAPEGHMPTEAVDTLLGRFTFYNAHRTQMLG